MKSGPTSFSQRLHALDVLRGVAVFGILVVNVEQMFLPMFYANSPVAAVPGELAAKLAWFMTDALFENKFVTLFSLLFGAGFALQWNRAADRGRGFVPRFLRRLFLLAVFGVIHAAFFYSADVLLIYALTALALLPWRRAKGKTLAVSGVILVVVTIAWGTVLSGPESLGLADRQRAAVGSVAEARKTGRVTLPSQELRLPSRIDPSDYPDWEPVDEGRIRIPPTTYSQPMPWEPAVFFLDDGDKQVQALVQYSVYSRGPASAARIDRLLHLARLVLLYTPVFLGWRTLGLFLIGASLFATGRLTDRPSAFWMRSRFLGLALGLPLSVVASVMRLAVFESQSRWAYLGHLLHDVSSLLLAAGFGGAVLLWSSSGLDSALLRSLSSVGRTALTNYIGQSVVMSMIATSYGFGLFGDLTRMQLLGLAVVCFALQMGVSSWWLGRFRNGPLEWIWRSVTYWRLMPLGREVR